MKILILALAAIFGFLQYEFWFSKNGIREYSRLKQLIHLQQQQNEQLAEKNQALIVETNNLKHGSEAIEEHARNGLGMIKQGETFYQVVNR
jgi:cell division protein FtsB